MQARLLYGVPDDKNLRNRGDVGTACFDGKRRGTAVMRCGGAGVAGLNTRDGDLQGDVGVPPQAAGCRTAYGVRLPGWATARRCGMCFSFFEGKIFCAAAARTSICAGTGMSGRQAPAGVSSSVRSSAESLPLLERSTTYPPAASVPRLMTTVRPMRSMALAS